MANYSLFCLGPDNLSLGVFANLQNFAITLYANYYGLRSKAFRKYS